MAELAGHRIAVDGGGEVVRLHQSLEKAGLHFQSPG